MKHAPAKDLLPELAPSYSIDLIYTREQNARAKVETVAEEGGIVAEHVVGSYFRSKLLPVYSRYILHSSSPYCIIKFTFGNLSHTIEPSILEPSSFVY